jgi:hypothetical protein
MHFLEKRVPSWPRRLPVSRCFIFCTLSFGSVFFFFACAAEFSCGTDAGGWLNGELPVESEGVVMREVCYMWQGSPCAFYNNIEMKSCGSFFVYNLVAPPGSCLRYCGEFPAASTVAPPVTMLPPQADPQCSAPYSMLNASTRSILFNDGGNNNIEMCDSSGSGGLVVSGNASTQDWRGPGWYRFHGDAGQDMALTAPGLYTFFCIFYYHFYSYGVFLHLDRSLFVRNGCGRLAQREDPALE